MSAETGAPNEKAPAEVQLDEGKVTYERQPVMNTVHPTTTVHPDIQAVLDSQPRLMCVTGGDLYREPQSEIVKTLDQVGGLIEMRTSRHSFGRFYRFDGSRVEGLTITGVPASVMANPNAVYVMDDGVFVSDGMFVPWEDVEVDGELAVRMLSTNEVLRVEIAAENERERAFIADNPAITAAMPTWADEIDVFIGLDDTEITYSRSNHAGSVGVMAVYQGGAVTFVTAEPAFRFEHEAAGAAPARAALALMQEMLDAVETERAL